MTYLPRDPKEQLIDELCANGHLEEYRETIRALLTEINDNGAYVSCKYNEAASNIDPSFERPKHIRASMINVKTPLNIIWVILHEYGHYLDWPRNPEHLVVQREEKAWQIAEEVLIKHPQLTPNIAGFYMHREWCLDSYYRNYGKTK